MATAEELTPEQRAAVQVNAILRKDPEVWRQAQRLLKKADPTLRIPEVELEQEITKVTAKQDEKIDGLVARNLELEAVNRRRDEADKSRAEGLDPAAVEKIVQEEKCSFATARKFLKAQLESAVPTAGEVNNGNAPGAHIDMRPEEDWRKIGQNRGALARHAAGIAHGMIDAFRGRGRAAAR